MSTAPHSNRWQQFLQSKAGLWLKRIVVFVLLAFVLNHLSNPDSFPGSDMYRFPIEGIVSSIVLCILITIITDLNFSFYEKKYFSRKVEVSAIVWYLVTTMAYITLMYIPLNVLLNLAAGGSNEFYFLLIGLLVTLLLSLLLIGILYAPKLYTLYQTSIKDAEITIESGAKTTKLTYEHIACFYIENKIVYTVQKDGTTLHTDFTLNELEEKINDQLFFRANRKMIIHKDAVDQIEKIENGKLRIRLKQAVIKNPLEDIVISRYKRQAFMEWFD